MINNGDQKPFKRGISESYISVKTNYRTMKTIKYFLRQMMIISFIGFISSLFFSCSNNLSRDVAEKLIKEKLQKIESRKLYIGPTETKNQTQYVNLENLGLITIKWWHYGGGVSDIDNMELTEKGKQYIAGKSDGRDFLFKVSDLDFGEITGIVEQKESNTAKVNYTLIRKNITPFGTIFGLKEGAFNNSITFTKFDDGWRIDK